MTTLATLIRSLFYAAALVLFTVLVVVPAVAVAALNLG